MRFLVLWGGLFCLWLSNIQAAWLNPHRLHLANGMQVVVLPNHKAPVVSHDLWIRAGALDDPLGKSGLAHFLEHLMYKGGGGVGIKMFDKELDRMGARHNAVTSWDYTHYYQRFPSRYLDKVMMIMAARLKKLELNQEIVTSERKVILEERFMRLDNEPAALLQEATMRSLFWNHPYGNSMIGWKHEMESLSIQDVLSFHERFYGPENCILILSGDITIEKAQELAQKHYGALSARGLKSRNHLQEPPHHGVVTRLSLRHERVGHPQYSLKFRLPSSVKKQDMRNHIVCELLAHILSETPLGILYQEFVVKQKTVSDVGLWIYTPSLGAGFGGLYAVPVDGKGGGKAFRKIRSYLKRLKIPQEALTRAQKEILIRDEHKKDSIFAGASEFGEYLVRNYSLEDVEQWPELVNDITLAEVQNLLESIMSTKDVVYGSLLPKGAASQGNMGASATPLLGLGH